MNRKIGVETGGLCEGPVADGQRDCKDLPHERQKIHKDIVSQRRQRLKKSPRPRTLRAWLDLAGWIEVWRQKGFGQSGDPRYKCLDNRVWGAHGHLETAINSLAHKCDLPVGEDVGGQKASDSISDNGEGNVHFAI